MMFMLVGRIARLLIFPIVGSALLISQGYAGPPEDFEAGRKAFRGGDIVGSMVPLKRAAEAGHAAAQALYAQILDRSELDEEAVEWFHKSALQNDPDGQYGYGSMLAGGEGIKRDLPAARAWIEKAAEQNHALAINLMAQSYINGQLSITEAERASPQALAALERAATLDFLPAVDALAQAYSKGGYGVTPNPGAAEKFAARARELRGNKSGKSAKQ